MGCQRLEYEEADTGGTWVTSDDGYGDANPMPADSSSSSTGPAPPPITHPCGPFECAEPSYCVLASTRCECWAGGLACDPFPMGPHCVGSGNCADLEGELRDACQIEYCGEAGGKIEGEGVVCNDGAPTCAGDCDLDPMLCDADGDGIPRFPCNGDAECTREQYCLIEIGGFWSECADVPAQCVGLPLYEQQACVGATFCTDPNWLESQGHDLRCHDASDTE